MSVRISTKYRISSDSNLLKSSYTISDMLKTNPAFPDPKPAQSVLQAACDDFRLASSMAGRKDRALLSAKNDKRAALISILDELNEYVTATSKGDKTMLLQSGFEIVGIRGESRELQPITELTVQSALPGTATTRVKRVTGARSYVHQYTTDPLGPDSVWVSETSLNREHTFSSLRSVSRYWFRVLAIGKGNQTVYSPPVAWVIQ
ncbi:hypothetical protein [Longitalea arenae]|uniref:hypothetical protein n=1 Tax=Longitalea arenae TaxID=2812558 RepID=UPI0019682191|nr:hypothetical protein [Longitalea arenae]